MINRLGQGDNKVGCFTDMLSSDVIVSFPAPDFVFIKKEVEVFFQQGIVDTLPPNSYARR